MKNVRLCVRALAKCSCNRNTDCFRVMVVPHTHTLTLFCYIYSRFVPIVHRRLVRECEKERREHLSVEYAKKKLSKYITKER